MDIAKGSILLGRNAHNNLELLGKARRVIQARYTEGDRGFLRLLPKMKTLPISAERDMSHSSDVLQEYRYRIDSITAGIIGVPDMFALTVIDGGKQTVEDTRELLAENKLIEDLHSPVGLLEVILACDDQNNRTNLFAMSDIVPALHIEQQYTVRRVVTALYQMLVR